MLMVEIRRACTPKIEPFVSANKVKLASIIEDRPIAGQAEDKLDRAAFVDNLIRALVREELDAKGGIQSAVATGLVVGLTGSWGLGKSSVLQLVREKLKSKRHVAVAYINPWIFNSRDDLMKVYFNELRKAVGRSGIENIREIRKAISKYQGAIHVAAAGVSIAGKIAAFFFAIPVIGWLGSFVAKKVTEGLKHFKKPDDPTVIEERKSLERKLKKRKVAVVVLIDELDRVEDSEVHAVAQMIKAVGDIEGVSYLVAYEPGRVAEALGRGSGAARTEAGEAYLEKIVQHPIPLRPLFAHDVEGMFKALLSEHKLVLPDILSEDDRAILSYFYDKVKTPRDLKRLTGAYSVLEPMIRGEIRPLDVLAYCWLLTKAPRVRQAIAEKFDLLVDDPDQPELIRRAMLDIKNQDSLSNLLGEIAEPYDDLLQLIFPRFVANRDARDGDRISRRRNLVRLLYLGDPPGIISRKKLEALWAGSPEAIAADLAERLASNELTPLIDRLDDLLPLLPADGDGAFWPALSATLMRPVDWLDGPNVRGAISEDAATYLTRLGIRDQTRVPRVREVVDQLIASGDLIFTPWILRKHMFRHGFANGQPARPGEWIFDRDETLELMRREFPRYREAIRNGLWLRRCPNVEALFCLKNAGEWNEDDRQSLTAQLDCRESRATLSGQLVPPGYLTDHATLGELLEVTVIEARMNEDKDIDLQQEAWLKQSLIRFKRVLSGSDPSFGE